MRGQYQDHYYRAVDCLEFLGYAPLILRWGPLGYVRSQGRSRSQ